MSNQKKPKSVSEFLDMMPLNLDHAAHDLSMNQMVYSFAHDIVHWLEAKPEAMEMFLVDLKAHLAETGDNIPPDGEDLDENILHNVHICHKALALMASIVDNMHSGDFPQH